MTRISITTTEKLQPEYIRAVECLDQKLSEKLDLTVTNPNNSILANGSFQFFEKRVATKHIPSSGAWRWNQTNARKEIVLRERNIRVKILKLIPRKRNTVALKADIPSLKIWQFELVYPNKTSIYALWCEKGLNPEDIPSIPLALSSGSVETKEIQVVPELMLQDFSFLSKWMDPSVACSFWPRSS